MTNNVRNAGRKKALTTEQIAEINKKREDGRSVSSLALEYGVSRQTMTSYIKGSESLDRICKYYTEYVRWAKANRDFENLDFNAYTMRMDYMDENGLCTSIMIDMTNKKVKIKNATDDIFHRAFGIILNPDWNDYEEFLEYRTFSESRGDKKSLLNTLGLTHYDRLSIVEKTGGRLMDDKQWIRIIYYDKSGIKN